MNTLRSDRITPDKKSAKVARRFCPQLTKSKGKLLDGRQRGTVFGEKLLGKTKGLIVVPAGRNNRLGFSGRQNP